MLRLVRLFLTDWIVYAQADIGIAIATFTRVSKLAAFVVGYKGLTIVGTKDIAPRVIARSQCCIAAGIIALLPKREGGIE